MDPLYWLIAAIMLECVVILWLRSRVESLRHRHDALTIEVTRMLALHQDYLASFDGRLRTLGSRTTGDLPVPTAEELASGVWKR